MNKVESMSRKREFFTSTGVSLMRDIDTLTEQEELSLMRRCQKCKQLKLLNDFFIRKKSRGLKSPYCKPCFMIINNEYKIKNPEKIKEIKKREYTKNKRKYSDREYKRKYGIGLEDFENFDF